jgi:hypothetical protein
MTGLYSCNSRVIALNNSSDVGLLEGDWYQNRLWCVQEYCFPSILDIVPKLDASSSIDSLLINRRKEVNARWFEKGAENNTESVIQSGALVTDVSSLNVMLAKSVSTRVLPQTAVESPAALARGEC